MTVVRGVGSGERSETRRARPTNGKHTNVALVMSMREWLLVMGERCKIQPADGRDRGRDASSDRGERKGNADVGVAALFQMLTRNKGGIGVWAELSTEAGTQQW